jgi:hypothetical protein
MAETLTDGTPFPVVQTAEASRAIHNHDLNIMRQLLRATGSVAVMLQLPEIVGFIPEEERDFFDHMSLSQGQLQHNFCPEDEWGETGERRAVFGDHWPAELEGTRSLITSDLVRLGFDPEKFGYSIELDQKYIEAENASRNPEVHADGTLSRKEFSIYDLIYFYSNCHATLFYHGLATFRDIEAEGGIRLDSDSIDISSSPLVQPPDYAIVRGTHITGHASPILTHRSLRTFGRSLLIPDPYDSTVEGRDLV